MLVTWTALRATAPVRTTPWRPTGALWWQAGHTGPGRAEAPRGDGVWWSVLATWDDEAAAAQVPPDDVEAWHVLLAPASYRGDAVLAEGAQPFDALPMSGRVDGAGAVLTFAGVADDLAEREFFRRFMHLGRDVAEARGHAASMVQAPAGGAVLTFSAWHDLRLALDWAYVQPQHAAAVARQQSHRLLATTGFLRCAVLSSSGTLGGAPDPLAGLRGTVA